MPVSRHLVSSIGSESYLIEDRLKRGQSKTAYTIRLMRTSGHKTNLAAPAQAEPGLFPATCWLNITRREASIMPATISQVHTYSLLHTYIFNGDRSGTARYSS